MTRLIQCPPRELEVAALFGELQFSREIARAGQILHFDEADGGEQLRRARRDRNSKDGR